MTELEVPFVVASVLGLDASVLVGRRRSAIPDQQIGSPVSLGTKAE